MECPKGTRSSPCFLYIYYPFRYFIILYHIISYHIILYYIALFYIIFILFYTIIFYIIFGVKSLACIRKAFSWHFTYVSRLLFRFTRLLCFFTCKRKQLFWSQKGAKREGSKARKPQNALKRLEKSKENWKETFTSPPSAAPSGSN